MKIFHLPDLGEGLAEAEIREWYIKEGDEVKVDQPIVSMETAKAVVDVPAVRTGKIAKLFGKAGDIIQTGAPLIEFEEGETKAAAGTVVGNLQESNTILNESPTGITPTQSNNAIKAIPAVRALAKRLNVDLANVTPSGTGGQITLEDVEKAATNNTKAPTANAVIPEGFEAVRGVRRAMALTMAASHAEVVPVTIIDDADIYAWPKGTDITLRVIRALIKACAAEPSLNAWFDAKAMARKLFSEIHLGLAIDSKEGLFVPVIKNTEKQTPEALRATIERFKKEVNARTIAQEDLKGATFVLSNVGVFAGRYANPIIVPPTVAILATGRIYEQAIVNNGQLESHRCLPLSLTLDHRAITGGEAARFLKVLIEDLEKTT